MDSDDPRVKEFAEKKSIVCRMPGHGMEQLTYCDNCAEKAVLQLRKDPDEIEDGIQMLRYSSCKPCEQKNWQWLRDKHK